jgi:hypothetical protein
LAQFKRSETQKEIELTETKQGKLVIIFQRAEITRSTHIAVEFWKKMSPSVRVSFQKQRWDSCIAKDQDKHPNWQKIGENPYQSKCVLDVFSQFGKLKIILRDGDDEIGVAEPLLCDIINN